MHYVVLEQHNFKGLYRMAKITLTDLASLTNESTAITQLNTNFQQIEDELNDKVFYRDNPLGETNTLENDIDLNSNSLLNVADINGESVSTIVDGLSTSAIAAAASATASAASATAASASASSASASASAAATSYDSFDDRYLGVKASDPALDNDGDALITGALYFDSTNGLFKVYNGSSWLSHLDTDDIGVTVQAYDADTAKYDDATANFTGTLQNGGSNVVVDSDIGSTVQAYDAGLAYLAGLTITNETTFKEQTGLEIGVDVQAYDATIVVDADIGVTVQGYDADTAKYDDGTANFTGTLQNGGSNVVVDTDIGSTVQAYDADTTKNDVANTFTATQTIPDIDVSGRIAFTPKTVASLPGTPAAGMRDMVSDSTVAASGNFGATVAGTGSNTVPVFYDGTNWVIG